MDYKIAQFRFYEELNDFLPPPRKKTAFSYQFNGTPSIKDAIEAVGVPHTEVDLILVNGRPVGFNYNLQPGDHVSVYPVFESFDISPLVRLRGEPLRQTKFILDVHLGKLAKWLRLLGFDTLYRNDYRDFEIVRIAVKEKRIILTRDRGILKAKAVTHGYWIRSTKPDEQIQEVLSRFDLFAQIRPFQRCLICNGIINGIDKKKVMNRLPAKTALYYEKFYTCSRCGKIYWKGSHHQKMNAFVQKLAGHQAP
jgi:uncharacterized protein with PIN domain